MTEGGGLSWFYSFRREPRVGWIPSKEDHGFIRCNGEPSNWTLAARACVSVVLIRNLIYTCDDGIW